jgi:hypothetical protein
MVIEPIPRVRPQGGPRTCFEVQFRPGSYGFRPGHGCKEPAPAKAGDALREVDRLLKEGYADVVDADFQGSRLPIRGGAAACTQEEPDGAEGQGEESDEPLPRRQPGTNHRRSQPDTARLVRLLPARGTGRLPRHRRLRPQTAPRIRRKQETRPGFGRCKADHQRWPNAFFAEHGLFTLQTAHAHARHSR